MRRLALALALALFAAIAPAGAQERIQRYDSEVWIDRNGTLTVTETIRVRAEGIEIRRGIYRDFPLTFLDAQGRRREVTFRLLDVLRDGRREPHFTRRNKNGIRIYAGDENTLLPRGVYTYTFKYETGRQVRWFDGGAEIFWNVTGNDWIFPIDRASVRVHLPNGMRPSKWTAYTGPYGARGTAWRGDIDANGVLTVETTQMLARQEGFSLVASLPDGAVELPGPLARLWYTFLDYRNWVIGGLGFLIVLGFYMTSWGAVGRDPRGGTIIPLFHPPKGVSPALASYIYHWGFGSNAWRAFTSAALSLAVRGLVLFDQKDDELTLKATGKAPEGGLEGLPRGERSIFDWINGRGGTAVINQTNGTDVVKAGKDFRDSIDEENRAKFFNRNLLYFGIGLALTVLVFLAIFSFGGMTEGEYVILIGTGVACAIVGLFILPILSAIFGFARTGLRLGSTIKMLIFGIFLVYFGSQLLEALTSLFGQLGNVLPTLITDYPFPFALVVGFATLNGLFLYLLRAPTDIGRKVMDELEGLRLYLNTAESARLNMNAPEITAERFEALLPYAVALDVEKPWAEAFQAALARAQPGTETAYQPRWSSGQSWSGSSIGSAVSSSVAAAAGAFTSSVPASSSGSSGFSGGGGSGGGGGGGGGGGW
jgi:hypothetical protein